MQETWPRYQPQLARLRVEWRPDWMQVVQVVPRCVQVAAGLQVWQVRATTRKAQVLGEH